MLNVVEFPQTFTPIQAQVLTDAFVQAADQLRYGPGDHDDWRNLALILSRLVRLNSIQHDELVREAVAAARLSSAVA